MTNQRHSRVAVISLAGTIAMVPQAGGGVTPALSASDLLAAVPGLFELEVSTEVIDFRQLPGASLGFADLLALAAEIDKLVEVGVDGVVITQGTDTIEETAYLLDLLYSAETAVVVTGAMRSATVAGADPANLLGALRVAASPRARSLGVLVFFADEIHAVRFVRKTHTTSITAFTSYPGALGYVVEDQVQVRLGIPTQLTLEMVDPTRQVRTAIATIGLGEDGELLRAIGGAADGLVVSAFGAGHVPATCVPILSDLASQIFVVLASRSGAGSVLSSTYGFPGSESDLLARGLISGRALDPLKARILLQLLLMAGSNRESIENAFRAAGNVIADDRRSRCTVKSWPLGGPSV